MHYIWDKMMEMNNSGVIRGEAEVGKHTGVIHPLTSFVLLSRSSEVHFSRRLKFQQVVVDDQQLVVDVDDRHFSGLPNEFGLPAYF